MSPMHKYAHVPYVPSPMCGQDMVNPIGCMAMKTLCQCSNVSKTMKHKKDQRKFPNMSDQGLRSLIKTHTGRISNLSMWNKSFKEKSCQFILTKIGSSGYVLSLCSVYNNSGYDRLIANWSVENVTSDLTLHRMLLDISDQSSNVNWSPSVFSVLTINNFFDTF